MRPRPLASLWLTVLALTCAPALARADVFEPIQLASRGVLAIPGGTGASVQAEYAHDAAISADGRYIAFDGYVGGYTGVWRRDLLTGEITPVAVGRVVPGSEECESVGAPCDAALPSLSEEGRYVSFTTTAPLEPALDANSEPDVYVRDMDATESIQEMEAAAPKSCETSPEPRACPFTVVSALDGSGEGLTYAGGGRGSIAAGRSAMSAGGEKVAFVTSAISNLAGVGTPAHQVAVRNLDTRETELVSVEDDPATGLPRVPATPVVEADGGSIYGAVAESNTFPKRQPYGVESGGGASISADGTTVAWMGQSIAKQARILSAEGEVRGAYAEPLWRRIVGGPLAPTRRVTGGSEPETTACVASGETQLDASGVASLLDPCQGPFELEEGGVYAGSDQESVPQLSADGYTVAFVATAPLVSLGQNYGLSGKESADLYTADMRSGETRRAALRPLTRVASSVWAGSAAIVDYAISPDGSQVAFSTQRIDFPLGSPAYISQPTATPEMAELFDVDLGNDTLTRVTHGFEGGPSERPHKEQISSIRPYLEDTDGALSPSFSADGSELAFSSTAANLVSGDGNTPPTEADTGLADGSDAFVVRRAAFSPTPVEASISPAPPGPVVVPEWRLGVTARSLANGRVVLYASIPTAGRLSADALGAIPAVVARSSRARARRRPHAATVVNRSVASAASVTAQNGEGIEQLTLALKPAYRALASRSGGLSATVEVVFTAPGRPRLRQRVAVTFLDRAKPARRARRSPRRHS